MPKPIASTWNALPRAPPSSATIGGVFSRPSVSSRIARSFAPGARFSCPIAAWRPPPIVVEPPARARRRARSCAATGPTSEFWAAGVALARAKSTAALVENETSPTRLPVPVRTSETNRLAASRASSIFVRPLAVRAAMLPVRSITTITSSVWGGAVPCMSWRSRSRSSSEGCSRSCTRRRSRARRRSRPCVSNRPEPEVPPERQDGAHPGRERVWTGERRHPASRAS